MLTHGECQMRIYVPLSTRQSLHSEANAATFRMMSLFLTACLTDVAERAVDFGLTVADHRSRFS